MSYIRSSYILASFNIWNRDARKLNFFLHFVLVYLLRKGKENEVIYQSSVSMMTQRRSRASRTLAKKVVNFSRENQVSSIIPTTKGDRTILLKFLQIYSPKTTEGVRISLENQFPQLETAKQYLSQSKTFQKKTRNF